MKTSTYSLFFILGAAAHLSCKITGLCKNAELDFARENSNSQAFITAGYYFGDLASNQLNHPQVNMPEITLRFFGGIYSPNHYPL